MANIERLREEVDFVNFNPEKHDQEKWYDDSTPECGTTGCLAGWTCAHEKNLAFLSSDEGIHTWRGHHLVRSEVTGYKVAVGEAAAEILGLTAEQSDFFFNEKRTVEDFYMGIKILEENPDATESELYEAIGLVYDSCIDEYVRPEDVCCLEEEEVND